MAAAQTPQMIGHYGPLEDSDRESNQTDSCLKCSRKSPALAFGLSFSSTLAPNFLAIPLITKDIHGDSWNKRIGGGLMATGLIIGPGAGHLYSHNNRAFYRGVIIRTIGAGIIGMGAVLFDDDGHDTPGFGGGDLVEGDALGGFLIFTGSVVVLVSVIGDIARADGSARSYNRKHRLTTGNWYPSILVYGNSVQVTITMTF
jgi:hypothetical protein